MNRRLAKRWGVVSGLLFVGACGGTMPLELTSSAFENQKARWLASGIRDYRFEYVQQCECAPATVQPTVVEVRDGVVTDVRYRDTGLAAAADTRRLFPTVDDLFARIDDAIQRHAATLVVSYDSQFGYPTRIEIDYDLRAVDDEIAIDASGLARL